MDATLTHTRRLVERYADCLAFYRDVLGFTVTFGDADSGYADLAAGEHTLALFDRAEMADTLALRPAGDGVVLVCAVPDVDAAADEVRTAGHELVTAPTDRPDWGIRTAHVRDPDGGLVELTAPLE